MHIDAFVFGNRSLLELRAEPVKPGVMRIIEDIESGKNFQAGPKWLRILETSRAAGLANAAQLFVDTLPKFRVLFLEGHIFDSLACELNNSIPLENEDIPVLTEGLERAVAEDVMSRVPALGVLSASGDQGADMVILNAFTRLLCRFPTIASDGGVGVSLGDADIVHAIHDALLLSLIELEKTDLVGASLSMEPEFPEVLAVIAENLSGRQEDADMRDSLINLSDRFLTYGGRLKHSSSTFARSLPYVVIPNGPSRPCQLFHALCSDLGVQAEAAEDVIAAMHGFDQWKELMESAQEPGEIKGVFDEDCTPPELAERRRLQIAILIGLEFPDDQTASIWDRLRPTARSGMPRLDGFRKAADRF